MRAPRDRSTDNRLARRLDIVLVFFLASCLLTALAVVLADRTGWRIADVLRDLGVIPQLASTLAPSATPPPTCAPAPTFTPYPTQTPYPTHTPYPTLTPYPTYTAAPTSAPDPVDTPGPEPSRTPAPTATLVTGDGGANVRAGPGIDYETVGFLEPGDTAVVTGRYEEWLQIDYKGGAAWVAGWVVNVTNVDNVPQVAPPSADGALLE